MLCKGLTIWPHGVVPVKIPTTDRSLNVDDELRVTPSVTIALNVKKEPLCFMCVLFSEMVHDGLQALLLRSEINYDVDRFNII
jgi:hypothetical protein